MTFMENLGANPVSGIYGQPKQQTDGDALDLVNKLKDREMRDFKEKSNFMSDLSLRQEQRMRQLYDPAKHLNPQEMPVSMMQDPNAMNNYQKGELSIRQQGVDLDKQKLAQQGKMGQEALDIKSQQEKLNQQKSDQINTQKQADMERKINESNQKIELAQQALAQKTDNAEAQLQAHKDLAAAMEERHKLELAQKQHQFDITSEMHQRQIDILNEKLKQSANSETTTEVNADGSEKTVTTKKGDSAKYAPKKQSDGSYAVYFPDGTQHSIPADKLDDWNQNHQPVVEKALSKVGGGEE